MNEVKRVVKIDITSIKPYFTIKNLLILIALCVIFYFLDKNPIMVISLPILFAILYSSYPFLIGEQSGIDALYRIFGIKPKNVVIGRYILSLILFIAALIIGLIFYFIFSIIGNSGSVNELAPFFLIYFLVYVLLVSFQYPLYFKLGYSKAKLAKLVAFVGIFIFGALGGALFAGISDIIASILKNPMLLGFSIAAIVVIVVLISINISIRFYKKKDF